MKINKNLFRLNLHTKLLVIVCMMFAFGYMLVPLYNAICQALGINILAIGERGLNEKSVSAIGVKNTQVDKSRLITVEFDANARSLWEFKPEKRTMKVHPGEIVTVNYEFQNIQNRTMSAQAIPSYAPRQAGNYFNKLDCFCFNQYTLQAGEKKTWPVVFVIDPTISKDIQTITLSYTFFEVGVNPALNNTAAVLSRSNLLIL